MNLLIPYVERSHHNDPLFEEFTYGDVRKRGRKLKRLQPGDYVFFHHTAKGQNKFIAAYYVVRRVEATKDVVKDHALTSKFKSPHIARWLAGERKPDDVMVFGDSRLSKVFDNPLPFSRKLAERLSLNIRFPRGRLESRAIADATREWRELTNQDVRILRSAIKHGDKSTDDSEVAYWFWNTDAGTRSDARTCDLWFEHRMAFSGDDWKKYGLPLGRLTINDICLMYQNGMGIVGAGRVREAWDRKPHRTGKLVYMTSDFPEYRIGIDWYIDCRDAPVDFAHVPSRFLTRIVKHKKAAMALVRRLKGRHSQSHSVYGQDEARVKHRSTAGPKPKSVSRFADESDIEGLRSEFRATRTKRSRRLRNRAFDMAGGVCAACRKDFTKCLGGRGIRVLQVHHRQQLSARDTPAVTKLADLVVVCANCHLLLHLDSHEALGIQELRNLLCDGGYFDHR
jgi:hypothetical protein